MEASLAGLEAPGAAGDELSAARAMEPQTRSTERIRLNMIAIRINGGPLG